MTRKKLAIHTVGIGIVVWYLVSIYAGFAALGGERYSLSNSERVTHWLRKGNRHTLLYTHDRLDLDLNLDRTVDLRDYALVQNTAGACIRHCVPEPI